MSLTSKKYLQQSVEQSIDYKFNENKYIEEFQRYIDSTYGAHYCRVTSRG